MKPRLLPLAVLGSLALATPASAADPQMWQTPSGNIACAAFGKQLRCDMRKLGNPAAEKPDSCEFDYGKAFAVTRGGNRGKRLCYSDAVGGPGTPTVKYGTTWRRGGFKCTVKTSGVRCTNPGGHGFFLRIGKQTLF